MSEYKTVRYEFKASYLDQEYIPLSMQNYINHYHELSNILDWFNSGITFPSESL